MFYLVMKSHSACAQAFDGDVQGVAAFGSTGKGVKACSWGQGNGVEEPQCMSLLRPYVGTVV